MGEINGVQLKGKNGKTYFIRDEALTKFEVSDETAGEAELSDTVELEARRGTHPDDGRYSRDNAEAAHFGVFDV